MKRLGIINIRGILINVCYKNKALVDYYQLIRNSPKKKTKDKIKKHLERSKLKFLDNDLEIREDRGFLFILSKKRVSFVLEGISNSKTTDYLTNRIS